MAHPLAGKPAPRSILANLPRLVSAYYAETPDPTEPSQRVAFGTSGHRGSSLTKSFNEAHILAIAQALVEHRVAKGIDGPLYLGIDTHALSEPARITALEVFAAHGVHVRIAHDDGYTPTPAVSHAILTYNRGRTKGLADGVVITPSHNPPEDGGFKYNPPHGGPADTDVTSVVERRANALLADLGAVRRVPYARALVADTTHRFDYVTPYVDALASIVRLDAIQECGIRIGVDPMGGAGIGYWAPIVERYGINVDVVNPVIDPQFGFMCVDKDGRIRMDCSSPYAMAGLIEMRQRYDISFGNDPDYDRHGVVTRRAGLLNPNHYLAAAIEYLFSHRPEWGAHVGIGKTLVSSLMIDRVAKHLGRRVVEVPVGFKWFVGGLLDGSFGFAGEESAGATFLRLDGTVWSTDKDGLLLDLLAAEIAAVTGRDPGEHYARLTGKFGAPIYERLDAPATRAQKAKLAQLSADQVTATELAGEPILQKITHAPGNGEAIGGLKVVTENGWFAARPSGTEDVYKIYTESFLGAEHLQRLQEEAKALVDAAFAG